MLSKCLAIAFLATASMTGAASAQTATNQVASATSATTHKEGEWRGSKLAGVDVYNEANEKIGDINDVILDRSGKGRCHSRCGRRSRLGRALRGGRLR
jgi:ribosomal 30S subunit maturation factor RimM